jgi:hypothetical protein
MKENPMASGFPRILFVVCLYILLIFGGSWLGAHINDALALENGRWNTMPVQAVILGVVLIYILMTAIPFVPGAEIGFALIMVFGTKIVAVVYCATILALLLAFGLGRLVSEKHLAGFFRRLGSHRLENLIAEFSKLDRRQRIQYLSQSAPKAWIPVLLRHRLLALALLVNLPGNSLVGGGGGIAMLAGISRIITFPQFVICISLAVAPVPLAVVVGAWLGQ